MRMYTHSFNKKVEAENFVNSQGITKEQIVQVFQEADKTYTLVYYAE